MTFRLTCALLAISAFATPYSIAGGETPASEVKKTAPGVSLFEGKRTLWLGDSITQDGRYVSFAEYLLQKAAPGKHFDIIDAGLSSETLSGLSEPGHAGGQFPRPCLFTRLDRALAATKPALVVACYGMNDGIYLPYDEARMDAFRKGVAKLSEACAKAGAKLILVTPPVYEGGIAGYGDVLDRFAAREVSSPPAGVLMTVDLHTPMKADLAARLAADPKFRITRDGIHPDELGHLLMATLVLKGLGVSVPETKTEDLLKAIKADPAWPVVAARRALRTAAWLDHIGYDREKHVPPGSGNLRASEARAAALQKKADGLLAPAK